MDLSTYLALTTKIRKIYQKELVASKPASSYLLSRVSKDSISTFKLGYCPNCFTASLFPNVSEEVLLQAGIFLKKESSLLDRFAERIVFPVNSAQGATLGFVSRSLKQSPFKYLNSEDGIFFKRSELFFGLDIAIPYIIRSGFVFICEGLFDVVAMHEAGFKNTIASLGTTLTTSQLETLKFFTDSVVILFDGDGAGQAATLKAKADAKNLGFYTQSICLPVGEDPDSLYHSIGREPFKTYINNSRSDS